MLSRPLQSFTAQTELNAWSFEWWFIIYSGGKLLSKIYSVRTEPSVTAQYVCDCKGDSFSRKRVFSIRKIYLSVSFHPFVESRVPLCIWQTILPSNVLIWILALRNFQNKNSGRTKPSFIDGICWVPALPTRGFYFLESCFIALHWPNPRIHPHLEATPDS